MQTIKIREEKEKFLIEDMVYPYIEGGILYLRLVMVDEDGRPSEFLIVQPQDIVYKRMPYSHELMRDVRIANEEANEKQKDYMAAVEEEMRLKAEMEKIEANTPEPSDVYYG